MPPNRPLDQNHLYPENPINSQNNYRPIIQGEVVYPETQSQAEVIPEPISPQPRYQQQFPSQQPLPPRGFDVGVQQPRREPTLSKGEFWRQKVQQFGHFAYKKWWLFLLLVLGVGLVLAGIYVSLPKPTKTTVAYTNVSGTITGPASLPSGSSGTWNVEIVNKESIEMQNVEIKMQYDRSFRYLSSDPIKANDLLGTTFKLAKLAPSGQEGSQVQFKIEGSLAGTIDEEAVVKAEVSYDPKPEKTSFLDRQSSQIAPVRTRITSAQVKLELNPTDAQVQSGAEAELTVAFENLADRDLSDLRLKMIYPKEQNSFQYTSSELSISGSNFPKTKPDEADNIWLISSLPRNKAQTLKVKGKVNGSQDTQLTFGVEMGVKNATGTYDTLSTVSRDITITTQPLNVTVAIPEHDSKLFTQGETLTVTIAYENRSSNTLRNLEINASLDDPANLLDFTSLKGAGSSPNPNGKTLEWRTNNTSQLSTLSPGAKGQVQYTIKVKSDGFIQTNYTQTSYTIKPKATMKSQSSQEITVDGGDYKARGSLQVEKTISFKPSGSKRIYTVNYTFKTQQTNVNNIVFTTSTPLPNGTFSPSKVQPSQYAAKTAFDSTTGKITIQIGSLAAYTGISSPIVTISLEFEVSPASNGKYENVEIMKQQAITGTDDFTGENYTITLGSQNAVEN